jgi:hypothetical protein
LVAILATEGTSPALPISVSAKKLKMACDTFMRKNILAEKM